MTTFVLDDVFKKQDLSTSFLMGVPFPLIESSVAKKILDKRLNLFDVKLFRLG